MLETENAAVRFVGRMDFADPDSPRFSWSGSGAVARFVGDQVSVSLQDSGQNQFTPVLDGQPLPKLVAKPGRATYVLARGLESGTHTIELYRRTEAHLGVTQFIGFDFGADGQLLAPPTAPERRIELVGDSISCGYGNEGTSASCPFSPDTENHYLTYGALAARELNAEISTIAWSGKGVVFNYGDDVDQPLPELYSLSIPTQPTAEWDFSWQPHVVVINLGTNDFSTDNDPSPELFRSSYVALLETIRARYPNAVIIGTLGTLLGGEDLIAAQRGIQAAVQTRRNAGDQRVHAWEMQVENIGRGCDYHPSLATHRAMADALKAELTRRLGW